MHCTDQLTDWQTDTTNCSTITMLFACTYWVTRYSSHYKVVVTTIQITIHIVTLTMILVMWTVMNLSIYYTWQYFLSVAHQQSMDNSFFSNFNGSVYSLTENVFGHIYGSSNTPRVIILTTVFAICNNWSYWLAWMMVLIALVVTQAKIRLLKAENKKIDWLPQQNFILKHFLDFY